MVRQNRERIDTMIDTLGRGTSGFDAAMPPVAVFDWDNTVIKNDIGDASVFYALRAGESAAAARPQLALHQPVPDG